MLYMLAWQQQRELKRSKSPMREFIEVTQCVKSISIDAKFVHSYRKFCPTASHHFRLESWMIRCLKDSLSAIAIESLSYKFWMRKSY